MSAKMCLMIFPLGSFLDSQMALLKLTNNQIMVHFFRVSTMLKFKVKREKVDSSLRAGSIFSTSLRIHLTAGWLAVQLKIITIYPGYNVNFFSEKITKRNLI